MPVILYQLTLEEPAILSALEGEPNSSVSYDFIPGSAVRGALIGRFIREYGDIDASNEDHRRLFFSNETRYLNAYPAFEETRSLPVPVTWSIPKYLTPKEDYYKRTNGEKGVEFLMTDSGVKSESEEERQNKDKCANDEEPRKPKSLSGFTYIDKKTDEAWLYEVKRVVNVHTRRARTTSAHLNSTLMGDINHRRRIERRREQQVFRYDAIAPEQQFIGAIYCADDKDANTIVELLQSQSHVTMGGARSAGYGLMRIDVDPNPDHTWYEAPFDPPKNNDTVRLTLLSDLILRDQHGEYATTSSAIKCALASMGINGTIAHSTLKNDLIGGFNRKWGLPLPQIPIIKRGSVITLQNVKADEGAYENLLTYGLGEQTLDGFGRVAVNWQWREELLYREYEDKTSPNKQPLSEDSKKIWSNIRQNINQQAVNNRMAGVVFSENYEIRGKITPTQLARIRTAISDELRTENPSRDALSNFLKKVKGKVAGTQIADSRIGKQSLEEWLSHPIFPELGESLQERDRFVLQLVDAVLERAHKEKTAKNKRGK